MPEILTPPARHPTVGAPRLPWPTGAARQRMIDMVRRHEIQVLRRAGHSLAETATLVGVSQSSVQRVIAEPPVTSFDSDAERAKREVGRPSKAEPFRSFLVGELAVQPDVLSVELLRRAKLQGYAGGKSALYALVKELRPERPRPVVRFEGLPGEFSQHDFGHVDVRFLDGRTERVHFFASRLKYSRWVQVSLVDNEQVEALVRAMVEHFAAWGGLPLLAVFDRPKTIALSWAKYGTVTEWNPTFGATGYVVHDTHPYSMPPDALGLPGTLYLYRDRVRIVAGRYQAEHPRKFGRDEGSTLPEHRAPRVAAVSGKRAKRYLKREHLIGLGEHALAYLTELVHRRPKVWIRDVDQLHDLLERYGDDALRAAFEIGLAHGAIGAEYIHHYLTTTLGVVLGAMH